MYDRNKNIFAYLLDLFIYLSPIKLFKFVPRSIITILHEKCIEISNKWTNLTPPSKTDQPRTARKETRKLSSTRTTRFFIRLSSIPSTEKRGFTPRKDRIPIPFQGRSLRNNYSQRGLTSLPPDLLVTNPK